MAGYLAKTIATGVVLICGVCGSQAQSTNTNTRDTPAHLTPRQARTLRHTANTPEQYEQLSRYYRERVRNYRDQEWQMNAIVLHRQILAANAGGKYLQTVKSGASLVSYYRERAYGMDALADEYETRAREVSPSSVVSAEPSVPAQSSP